MCVVCDACFVCFHAKSTLEPFVLRVCIHNSLFVCCSWHNTHALHRFSRCYHAQRIQRAHIVVICPLTTSGCSSYVANFNHVLLRIMQRFTSQRHYVSDMPNHMSKSECNGDMSVKISTLAFSSYIALNILAVFASASLIRAWRESAEKPPKTTECVAPIRAQASIETIASGIIGK